MEIIDLYMRGNIADDVWIARAKRAIRLQQMQGHMETVASGRSFQARILPDKSS